MVADTASLQDNVARATAPGELPTITTTKDGTLQLLTNNNSGDELQLRKDGTLTFVNGGNSPGIFSVSGTLTPPSRYNFAKHSLYLVSVCSFVSQISGFAT